MIEYINVGRLNRKLLKRLNIQLITDEVKNILDIAIYKTEYIYRDWNNRENTLIFIKSICDSTKICIIIKIAQVNDEKLDKYE